MLEETLQRGLAARLPGERRPVRIRPLPLGVRPAVLGTSLNQVFDQLELEADRNASPYDSEAPRHAAARLWWEAALSGVVHSDDRDFGRFAGLRWRNPLG